MRARRRGSPGRESPRRSFVGQRAGSGTHPTALVSVPSTGTLVDRIVRLHGPAAQQTDGEGRRWTFGGWTAARRRTTISDGGHA